MSPRLLTALGVVFAALGSWTIHDQLPLEGNPARCWFFDPLLSESSFSEMATLAGYLVAVGLCLSLRRRAFLFLGAFFFALFLEEANYGKVFLRLFQGPEVFEGKALHNLVEDRYTDAYHAVEYAIQIGLFALTYGGVPAALYLKVPGPHRPWRSWLAAVPLGLWVFFLVREGLWEARHGVPVYPNHVCVSTDEEIVETLYAFSAAYLLLIYRFWPRAGAAC